MSNFAEPFTETLCAIEQRRILLIEDYEPMFELLRDDLLRCGGSEGGIVVCGARLMSTAEEILAKYPIDLIVSDLSLPDSRGPSTVLRLRRVAPLTPLLILTGREDEEILRRCEQLGADACRFKGEIGGEELLVLIRTLSELRIAN